MITTRTFRAAEAMLLAAKISSAEALMTAIALAIETMTPTPLSDEVKEPDRIVLRLAVLADRLGWDQRTGLTTMLQVNGEVVDELGFTIGTCHAVEGADKDEPWFEQKAVTSDQVAITLSPALGAVVRGTALIEMAREDPRAMNVDAGSAAMVALVSRLAAAGGACLYRETETADGRVPELMAVAATIAAEPTLAEGVVVHDRSDRGRIDVPPTAALLAAALHGACVLFTTDKLLDQPSEPDDLADDDAFEGVPTKAKTAWSPLSSDGASLAKLLPHAPLAVVVPIPRHAVLSPRQAAAFVTAIGPLRRDRAAASASLRDMAEGRLSDAVSDRLVDLWDARPEHARTSLEAIGRMIENDMPPHWANGPAAPTRAHDTPSCEAYSAMADAMTRGLAPHVWSPLTLQPKPKVVTFFRELFVCEPDADLLFSERLRDEPGVRILMAGVPGTGKSAAASHIASAVLGMPTLDLKAGDVLFYRLGALERAIADAFRQARERSAVLIIDEADSLVQDRATASQGSLQLVTAITNTILIELDRHDLPVIMATNFADRIDPAVKRRLDFTFEVKPIPEELELRALRLLLDLDPPETFAGFGGDTVISDYAGAKRVLRLQGGGGDTTIAAVRRARDVRLGRHAKATKKIGF